MNNIVLFGGSNSAMKNGFREGLSNYARLLNLSLGASTAIQNLYELKREKNQEFILNADLIVTESNLNEIVYHSESINLHLNLIARNLQWFYESLSKYNKPVCILILPYWDENYEKINNMHRYFANFYGFNVIDMHNYYDIKNLKNFGESLDRLHQMNIIMRHLGENISKNIKYFHMPKQNISSLKLPNFKVLTPREMIGHGVFKTFNPKSFLYNEIVFRLEGDNYLSIDINGKYVGYEVIGIHSWNLEEDGSPSRCNPNQSMLCRNSVILGDDINQVRKTTAKLNQFLEVQTELIISNNFTIKHNNHYVVNTEISLLDIYLNKPHSYSTHFDLVSLFLCSPYDKSDLLDLDKIPSDEVIKIEPNYDFTYLIPDIEFYRDCMDFVDEYFEKALKPKIQEYIKEELFKHKVI